MKAIAPIILFFLAAFIFSPAKAQTDDEFWFVAPAITAVHGTAPNGAAPVSFKMTTLDLPATVTITQPANAYDAVTNPTGFVPITVTIPANSSERVALWEEDLSVPANAAMRKIVENKPAAQVLNRGIHIQSTSLITAYYEVEETNNNDIFALKGKNALGDEFYCSFQNYNNNNNYDDLSASPQERTYSAIDIVSVEDGTKIWVYPSNPIEGHATVAVGDSFSITLNRGQTYSLVPQNYSKASGKRLNGTRLRVEGGKRIAVTLKDDSVISDGCRDLIGDQTIPLEAVDENGNREEIVGKEYIVMKGDLIDSNQSWDRIYILGTQPNTIVVVTDVIAGTSSRDTIDAGETYRYQLSAPEKVTYVNADKPVYVLHVTGSGKGCEIGGAILPSVTRCTGSAQVGFSRSSTTDKDFIINIMIRDNGNGAKNGFTLTNSNGVNIPLPASITWTHVFGDFWATSLNMTAQIQEQPISYILANDIDIFHMGIMNAGQKNGGEYGYFSDYATVKANGGVSGVIDIQPGAKLCYGDSTQLIASGGVNYKWIPSTYLDDPYSPNPICKPKTTDKYKVIVYGASCAPPDTAEIEVIVSKPIEANFYVDYTQGCAPFNVTVTNAAVGASKGYQWYFGDSPSPVTDSVPAPHLYNNKSDTAITYTLKQIVSNEYCSKVLNRDILIYPQINAKFSMSDTVICHATVVDFTNKSSGNTDTYNWEFGDFDSSPDENPSHTYKNFGNIDSVYNIELVATSPFYCRDTANAQIRVHPYIMANFASLPTISCSPLQVELDPKNSIGVDTFFWHVYDSKYAIDSMYIATNENKIPFYHNDNTQAAPDSIYIGLLTRNDEGCYDTVPDRLFVIYPEVHSVFSPSADTICDSIRVTFNNNSVGYNLEYYWDFDNGNSLSDTTGNNINHIFYNRGTIDSVYNVTLITQSDYTCYDTSEVAIVVHPYVDARFTVELPNNCAPLQANIQNSSAFPPNSQFDWDMGDGKTTYSYNTNVNILHSFTNTHPSNDSVYTINLTVTSPQLCKSSFEKDVLVYPQILPRFNLNVDKGCQPLLVDFRNISIGGTLTYDWEFGDQSSSDTAAINFSKNYENASINDTTYYITLKAINEHGCSNEISDSVEVYAFINANFDLANPDSCSPFPLDINNTSKGGITQYSWNFDDSSPIDINFEPNHTYSNKSNVIYYRDLELVVENSHACYDTFIRQVTVYPEVTTDFATSDNVYENCQPFLVNFVNGSNIPATNFKWDFGDGYDSGDKTPGTHTFENKTSSDVTYPVTLIATSDYGCSDTASHNIIAYAFIESNFTLADKDSCSPFPLSISNASKGGIDVYNWNFDDGTQSSLAVPTHTYENKSNNVITRNLSLVVKNTHACYDTLIKEVKVYPEVVVDFTTSDGVYENCQPFDVQFNVTNNAPAKYFVWDFGDAGGSNSRIPAIHRFTNSGTIDSTYTVSLTATSEYGCSDDTTHDIIAYAFIESNFAVENTDSCSPFPLRVNNLSLGGVDEYFWNFGDGTVGSNTKTPTHTYKNKSNVVLYPTLELVVKNQHACYDTLQQQITVFPEVFANFSTSSGIYEACQPFDVQFENNSNAPAKYFIWDMDDGDYPIDDAPLKKFENYEATDHVYHVNLYAESEYRCSDDTTIDIIAYAYTEAGFSVDDDDVCYGYPILVTNQSSPGSALFSWNFGNGDTRNDIGPPPPFSYTWLDEKNGRTYNLSLTARNSHGCPHTKTHPIKIFPEVRAQIALSDSMNCHPLNTKFFNISQNVDASDKFYWNFGNNSGTSTSFQPYDREFTNEGLTDKVYNVILRAEERDNGCFGYDTLPITVHANPQTSFELVGGKTKGCPYFPVNIENTTNPVQDYANTYHYIFGDKSFPVITANKNNVTHDYDNVTSVNQNYNLTLITTSAVGCKDTAFQTLTVHPRVTANFEPMSATESCSPYILEFEDRSVNEHVYQWSFGDGNISSDKFPSNRYVNDSDTIRTYKVLLKAISDYQCWDTASTVVTIYPQPTALFYATPHSQHYPSADVEVENRTNHASIWNYDWDYDDNTTHVTNYNPDTHTYGYWGEYDIKMRVWSNYCSDSMTRTITVYPALPIASFDTSVQGCVPLIVIFKDNSIYGSKHTWDFDDGNSYTSGPGNNHQAQLNNWGEEVTHVFTEPGLYNVILSVEGDGGYDQTNNIVEVYPKPDVSFDIAPKTVMLPDEKIQTFNSTVAKPDFRWLWSFGDGSHSTSKEPEHLYTELGKYDISLVVWTENMCVDSLVLEQIVSVEGTGIMEFPNAFIPSLNGPSGGSYSINSPTSSVFHPYHDGVVDYRLEIYTRWGELIFVSEDVNIGWDGYINGTLAKQDVYVWRVKGSYTNGNPFIKAGDVTLIVSPVQRE